MAYENFSEFTKGYGCPALICDATSTYAELERNRLTSPSMFLGWAITFAYAREQLNIATIASRANVSPSTIYAVLAGGTAPSAETMVRLARATETSALEALVALDTLLEDDLYRPEPLPEFSNALYRIQSRSIEERIMLAAALEAMLDVLEKNEYGSVESAA